MLLSEIFFSAFSLEGTIDFGFQKLKQDEKGLMKEAFYAKITNLDFVSD